MPLLPCCSSLTGTFRRQGGFVRPLVSVGTVVVLLALGLAVDNLAARHNVLIPLMWVQASARSRLRVVVAGAAVAAGLAPAAAARELSQ